MRHNPQLLHALLPGLFATQGTGQLTPPFSEEYPAVCIAYPPSTSAAPDGRYQSVLLAQDAVALITALGAERAMLVGHDWGAQATYGAAVLAPERITRIVTLAAAIWGQPGNSVRPGKAGQRELEVAMPS